VNLAQGLAEEWAEDGIRVNAVSPERTDTPMRRKAFPEESRAALLQPDEVARATIGLISSPLTGQVLDVRRGEPAGEPSEAGGTAAAAPGTVGAGRRPAREP
jgi:2-C-methyl-D-erythritol 4-phosphate cytidylyltransferase